MKSYIKDWNFFQELCPFFYTSDVFNQRVCIEEKNKWEKFPPFVVIQMRFVWTAVKKDVAVM